MLTRRQFAAGAVGTVAAAALARTGLRSGLSRELGSPPPWREGRTVTAELVAAERPAALSCFGGRTLPMWTFSEGSWPPLIRLDIGDRLEAVLENRLPRADEVTSIHWHGIRLANGQDGVPYLVQPPVAPGASFRYHFRPPDTGTFFFHTHCNTAEQVGRGLEGVLVIDGDITEPYDADEVLFIRDWQVAADATEFSPFFTLRGAGRAGTYGPLRSVNGAVNPAIDLPASGDCRLRLINGDPTRIMQIGVENAEAAIVAIDGIAVPPEPFSQWIMGPGTRIDLVLRAPPAGEVARLVDRSVDRVELARFVGSGAPRRSSGFSPAPLRAHRIAEPDLAAAERLAFVFRASEEGRLIAVAEQGLGGPIGELCLSTRMFWTIDDRAWPDRGHARLPPPLALLERGRSYIFELKNDSQFTHPIHIHGHTFKFLRSDKRPRPVHRTDTMLLAPGERAEVAFVADNPGDWMLHCHIIEHQETGMMGYLRVA